MATMAPAGRQRRLNLIPYLFILPAGIVLAVVMFYPTLWVLWFSFFSYQLNMPTLGIHFVGLGNYAYIFQNKQLIDSTVWTLEFAAVAVTAELIIGMIFASVLNSEVLGKLREPLRAIFLIPLMLSAVVSGLIWRLLFDPEYGPINHLLSIIGVGMVHWGATVGTARLMVIIADIWICTPFSMLVLLAGMQSIPKDLFEVAAIDGASPIQLFRYITLPLLKYPIMVVAVIRSMDALRVFDMIYSLTGGISGPNDTSITIMFNIYRYAFNYFQVGRASALSVLLIVMLFIISVFMMRLLRREAYS